LRAGWRLLRRLPVEGRRTIPDGREALRTSTIADRYRPARGSRHAQRASSRLEASRHGDDGNAADRRSRRSVRASTQEERMDAIALLKEDHRKVKELLAQLEATTERGVKTRTELFGRLKSELTVHEIIEEEIFYPTLKQHPKAKEIVLEGYEEHDVVNILMGELEALPVDDETWGPKAKVMIENIEHHIEEEEGDMFVKARQVFDRADLDQLGKAMAERKQEAQSTTRAR
jgi:hemerythrin-like domain-containing protein